MTSIFETTSTAMGTPASRVFLKKMKKRYQQNQMTRLLTGKNFQSQHDDFMDTMVYNSRVNGKFKKGS